MTRIIALIDMDCFYVQVEQRLNPKLYKKPVAVCQLSSSLNPGAVLAVSYEARMFGIKRGMSAAEMKQLCPEIELCIMPVMENMHKTDLSRYRSASDEVFRVLENLKNIEVEKASIDEAYLDMTKAVEMEVMKSCSDEIVEHLVTNLTEAFPSTYLADGNDIPLNDKQEQVPYQREDTIRAWLQSCCRSDISQLHLAVGARIVEKIRREILDKTSFHCSAGIGFNKVISKLVCARHKPKQQTIISPQFISKVYETTSIGSVRNLGGKLGMALSKEFGVKTMADLASVPQENILDRFPQSATWLLRIIEGDDDEPIRAGIMPKSIAVSKNFPGKNGLNRVDLVEKWVIGLSKELSLRLTQDQIKFQRTAQNLVVGFYANERSHNSKTFPLISYAPGSICLTIWNYIRAFNKDKEGISWSPPISNIHISSGRFQNGVNATVREITSWFEKSKGKIVDQESFRDTDSDDITIIDFFESVPLPVTNNEEKCKKKPTILAEVASEVSKESMDIEIVSENLVERSKTIFNCIPSHVASEKPTVKSNLIATKKNAKSKAVKKTVARPKKNLAKKEGAPSQKISEFFRV